MHHHWQIQLFCFLCSLSLCAGAQPPLIQPFSSDGCSLFPDRAIIGATDWCRCCLQHDLAYWRGGTEAQRLLADQALKTCVTKQANNAELAELMFNGVRIGGAAYSIMPYRWGYGRQYGRFNQPLSHAEKTQADQQEQVYLRSNPNLACPSQNSIRSLR